MHIVCPHCTTSYAIDLATLGAAGRTVRCSRCKEVWLARPEDAVEVAAAVPAMARPAIGMPPRNGKPVASEDSRGEQDPPIVDSPSISADWPADGDGLPPASVERRAPGDGGSRRGSATPAMAAQSARSGRRSTGRPAARLSTACAAMGALVLALVIWRVDVVRLLPQTAAFYKMVGLEVNLRGLVFKDVKITNETVEGKPVLVIEGMIEGRSQQAGRTAAAALQRPRRAGRGDLRLERGAGAGRAEAGRTGLVQVAAGLAAARRAQYRRALLQQAGTSPAATHELGWTVALAQDGGSMPRVLIADDEESMRTLVARAIAMDGHDTVTAEDGAEALEILSREPGAFDLLLTDIQMPVMDGIALALAAARDFPDLTILLMTGFADQRERASGLNAIVHDVVTKPFSVADIRTAVAGALAARKR